jgi:hypothetical protein
LLDVRKFWSAARAPSVVEADAGMIVGGGKGAVYGMRIRGMPGTHSFSRRRHFPVRMYCVREAWSSPVSQRRMSSPALT